MIFLDMLFVSFAPLIRVIRIVLSCHVRQKSHEPRALDGERELTLVLGRDTRPLRGLYAAVRIQELLQKRDILVVDMLDIVL